MKWAIVSRDEGKTSIIGRLDVSRTRELLPFEETIVFFLLLYKTITSRVWDDSLFDHAAAHINSLCQRKVGESGRLPFASADKS